MFRSLARLQGCKSRSGLDHCLASLSRTPTLLIDENARRGVSSNPRSYDFESKRKAAPDRVVRFGKSSRSNEFTASSTNRTKTRPPDKRTKSTELPSEQNDEAASLLNSIAPKVRKLTGDELEVIHKKLFDLYHSSTGRAAKKHYRSIQSLVESPVYGELLEETGKKMQQFNANSLVTVFRSLSSFDYDERQSQIIKKTMQSLRGRLKELDLEQLFACLNSANYNMRDLKLLRGGRKLANVFEFSQELLEETKSRILNSKFDRKDTEMVVKNIQIFLRPLQFDEEVISHFVELLRRPQIQLSYLQSTILLGKIKKTYLMYTQFRSKVESTDLMQSSEFVGSLRERTKKFFAGQYLPKSLASLVDKCNSSIHASFKSNADGRDIDFYFSVLHDTVNPVNNEFDNFYDPKLLHDFVAPHLMQSSPPNNHHRNLLLHNLTFDYYLFQRCDERLLRLVYDSICQRPDDWRKFEKICNFYPVFTKYRLPFVDANRLAECLLDPSGAGFQPALNTKMTSIGLLCDLLLNDVTNETLYDQLDRKIERLKGNFRIYNQMKKRLYAKICLARVYLSMFDVLGGDLKQRISTRLDAVVSNVAIAERQPPINTYFLRINSHLQSNGYLSNGLYLDTWAIYDKSTRDLVPLGGHDFNKIDEIPLTSDQQL